MFRCLIVDNDKKEICLYFPASEEALELIFNRIKRKTGSRTKIADLESP